MKKGFFFAVLLFAGCFSAFGQFKKGDWIGTGDEHFQISFNEKGIGFFRISADAMALQMASDRVGFGGILGFSSSVDRNRRMLLSGEFIQTIRSNSYAFGIVRERFRPFENEKWRVGSRILLSTEIGRGYQEAVPASPPFSGTAETFSTNAIVVLSWSLALYYQIRKRLGVRVSFFSVDARAFVFSSGNASFNGNFIVNPDFQFLRLGGYVLLNKKNESK